MNIDKIYELVAVFRQDVLKGLQYASIFITWFHERSKNKVLTQYWFSLYQKLFHSRRLFRVLSFIIYLPKIRQLIDDLKANLTFKSIFSLLGNIFVSLFLLFDNASVILMMVGNKSYRTVRRISYSILLFGIVWQIISMAIVLRQSFSQQSDLKKQLEEMTPVQFLQRLNDIDQDRKFIAIQFVNLVGDFVPALARTNMPQIILKTKVNKGTVGFFGMIASITGILLKIKKNSKQGLSQKFL